MRQKKGVTLAELLILLACIAFTSAVAIATYDRTLAPDTASSNAGEMAVIASGTLSTSG